jgi:hypothetical protein
MGRRRGLTSTATRNRRRPAAFTAKVHRSKGEYPMHIRIPALAALAAVSIGAAACSQPEQDAAQADAHEAAADTGQAAEAAGASLQEEAAQVGSAIAAGASEVAQEVDEATDNLDRKADAQKAETAADTKGN